VAYATDPVPFFVVSVVEDHRIEIDGDEVSFFTGTEKSVLDTKEIVALTFYRWIAALQQATR
jgi:hypothetical protein